MWSHPMKYLITFCLLSACGVWAASAEEAVDTASETEKSSGEKVAEGNDLTAQNSYGRPAYINTIPESAHADPDQRPIPALILPNNICVINTDLSPDRTIEEHILACIHAQRTRRSIRR